MVLSGDQLPDRPAKEISQTVHGTDKRQKKQEPECHVVVLKIIEEQDIQDNADAGDQEGNRYVRLF